MPDELVIRRAELSVAAGELPALRAFYEEWGRLGEAGDGGFSLPAGSGAVVFVPSRGRPFHHFALLVPGDRFSQARSWLGARAPLLAERGTGETTFEFGDWDALACYVADPAGNIVELIAHAELCRSGRTGPFDFSEVRAISEVGLVVDDRDGALRTLSARGIELWSGSRGPGGLSFAGRKGHTLILVAPGRGWLPTGAPAERSAATVVVSVGDGECVVAVHDGKLAA